MRSKLHCGRLFESAVIIGAILIVGCTQGATDIQVKLVRFPGATVPDAEIDAHGVIHAAYLSGNDVYYVQSSDEGAHFSDPIRVNTEAGFAAGGWYRGPDLALGKDDRVHVTWYNNGYAQKRPDEERGIMYARMNDARTGFEASRHLSGKKSDNYSLAADDDGNVAAI